jgi:NTP pyrophosphatase (non-canonical NTP hydrolase)
MSDWEWAIDFDGNMNEATKQIVRQGVERFATAVSNTAHAHGWWDNDLSNNDRSQGVSTPEHAAAGDRNMGEMIALMHSELSEALEAYRNNEPPLWYKHDAVPEGVSKHNRTYNGRLGKPEGIASEFADVIIRILDTCHTLEIPVVQALLDKHQYNINRPYRHGGKSC